MKNRVRENKKLRGKLALARQRRDHYKKELEALEEMYSELLSRAIESNVDTSGLLMITMY
jgi:hypothetical protein